MTSNAIHVFKTGGHMQWHYVGWAKDRLFGCPTNSKAQQHLVEAFHVSKLHMNARLGLASDRFNLLHNTNHSTWQ